MQRTVNEAMHTPVVSMYVLRRVVVVFKSEFVTVGIMFSSSLKDFTKILLLAYVYRSLIISTTADDRFA